MYRSSCTLLIIPGAHYLWSFLPVVSANDVAMLSTGGISVADLVLGRDAKMMLLEVCHHLEKMCQLYAERELGCTLHGNQVHSTVQGDRATISKT